MTGKKNKGQSELISRAAAIANRRLSRRELERALQIPIGEDEARNTLRLIRWFSRRYPTAIERLAYIRRAHKRWRAYDIEL
jgi:hypothetical protein